MKIAKYLAVSMVLVAGVLFAGAPESGSYRDGAVLAKFQNSFGDAARKALLLKLGATDQKRIGVDVHVLRVAPARLQAVLRQLRANPAVRFAEPDYVHHATGAIPNDASLGNQWGLRKHSVKVEQPIDPDFNLRPTFSSPTRDFHTLCVEVSKSVYPNYLDAFVLSCLDRGMPIILYVAVRKGVQERNYAKKLKAAKLAGVGILEVSDHTCTVMQSALSLSLTGVRAVDVMSFPKQFRHKLVHAEQTFRNGSPAEACSIVYGELEDLFRKFAQKAASKSWWPNKPGFNIKKGAWATIVTDLDKSLDRASCGCPELTPAFMARIHGVTPFRNDVGHKPANAKLLIKRDRELRTRFESAVDLFRDFADATRKHRL